MCVYKPCKKAEALGPAFGVLLEFVMSAFKADAAVARRSRNELAALEFTRSTHLVHSLGSARDRPSGMTFGLRNAIPSCNLGLASEGDWYLNDRATATLWVEKHRLAHKPGELADLPKRR